MKKKTNPIAEFFQPVTQLFKTITKEELPEQKPIKRFPVVDYAMGRGIFGIDYFNGEKNLGGIGPVVDYYLDYEALRSRSYKAWMDSEVAQTILGKFSLWVIGAGLKLQAEPVRLILEQAKIKIDKEKFNDTTEARFAMFCNSTDSDYSGMRNVHQLAERLFLHSKIGGDMLVVLRYVDEKITVQIIDGTHVRSPLGVSDWINDEKYQNGKNRIRHGIEIDETGRHTAFYVQHKMTEWERIPATSPSSGLVTAFMVYGHEYRMDNIRGIPLIASVMQTLAQLDRYKEATLGAAEESAKVVYTVEHQAFSSGEDPLVGELKRARGGYTDDIPVDEQGRRIAKQVAATTNKMTYNMPIGAQLKAFNSVKELYFKDFYKTNIDLVCSTVGIPPNVAMSVYDSSYSSSRAAIKEWEHTINVNRKNFSFQFYSRLYAFWLDIEILKNNIPAPGYVQARVTGNKMVLAAYRNARFVGASVPHIDPMKEVQAARLRLGDTGNSIPLSTVEQETEMLNTGDSDANLEQYAEELEYSKKLGIKPEPLPVAPKPAD